MKERYPKVSVILLTYNCEKYLKRCLESLSRQKYPNYELIIVDNGSRDKSLEIIYSFVKKRRLKNVRVITLKRNFGYCEGNNIGARYSTGEFLVFLNCDVYTDDKLLFELVRTAMDNEKAGIVACKILYPNGRINSLGLIFDIYGATKLLGWLSKNNKYMEKGREVKIFSHHGACFLIKRKTFEEIGGFDSKLFLYYDEFDLAWRARLLGYDVILAPNARCIHYERPLLGNIFSKMKVYYIWRNRLRILLKNYSLKNVFRRFLFAIFLTIFGALFLSIFFRDCGYIIQALRALIWNLKKLKNTLKERIRIQSMRKIPDEVIEKNMLPYSKEIRETLRFLFEIRKK